MKAIFLEENEYFDFPKKAPKLMEYSLDYYSMDILAQSNIPVVKDVDEVEEDDRVLFLYKKMPLLEVTSLLSMLLETKEGYIADEFVCMYWVKKEKAHLPFEKIKNDLVELSFSESCMVILTPKKLSMAEKIYKERRNDFWMEQHIYIKDPATTYIGLHVQIEEGASILPNTYIYGKTTIGEESVIGPNTSMFDSKIGKHSHINQSEIAEAEIGNACVVGPFAYIRPGTVIGNHVKVGNFVEVKNSILGDGTKASHLAYIGDADIGRNVNVGCGSVFVNYDGKEKHRTTIEDDVFIGCNTNIIAPLTAHENAMLAAGSTITEDVPKNGMAIARSRQTNKESYIRR